MGGGTGSATVTPNVLALSGRVKVAIISLFFATPAGRLTFPAELAETAVPRRASSSSIGYLLRE